MALDEKRMEWRSFDLRVPDIASASDEEIEALFPSLDGRWSGLTRWLIDEHRATGLDLDQNWASVCQDWSCPCCLRPKTELARKLSSGVLLAHLHEHHDHIHDYMAARLQETYGKEWPRGTPSGTYELEHSGSVMIERFERTLVCEDCNAADAGAKARSSRTDPHFSFRPSEIATFITSRPNRSHEIDADRARAIWEVARADFLERIALADHLIAHIHRGAITRERTRGVPRWTLSHDAVTFHLTSCAPGAVESIAATREAMIARSIARDGVGAARPRSSKAGARPTADEVAAHDGGQFPSNWKQVPTDWRCAACDRDRTDVPRRSRKSGRRWSGEIRRHVTYLYGPSPSPNPAEAIAVAHEVRFICDGCDTLLGWLRSKETGVAPKASTLSIDQIRRCVDAGPNRKHLLDIDTVRAAALEAEIVAPAIAAYQSSVSEATAPRGTYRYFLERKPGDWAYAWREVVDRYRKRIEGETIAAAQERIRCLVSLADRLVPLDNGRPPFLNGSTPPSADDLAAFAADLTQRLSWT